MQKINILDFQVANLIAAGEVVDRPASVIKELVENAIDAGAREIVVEIRRGGVSYIRVTDNGSGMSRDDAELCILRHATSKIKEAQDLDAIVTLGFRGEALAAISSVSQMSIVTKMKNDPVGTEVICDCGRITSVSDAGCRTGTTVIVRELFANVPARRKFLKRDQSEGMACAAVLEKEALAHPEIAFRLLSDGSTRFQTAGDKKLFNAIYAILGKEFASKLIKVESKTDAVEVFGYIGRPDNVRANRNFQNFFINGRYIKSRTATAALEQAYSSFMESERFPCCVLNIVIHPALVDVNVHPTKLEVKFSNEKTVFDAVYLSVRNALLSDVTRPELPLEKKDIDHKAISTYNSFVPVYDRMENDRPEQTTLSGQPVRTNDESVPPSAPGNVPRVPFDDLPFVFEDIVKDLQKEQQTIDAGVKQDGALKEKPRESAAPDIPPYIPAQIVFEAKRESGDNSKTETPVAQTRTQPPAKNDEPAAERSFKLLGVAFETYIIVELGDKLMMIDKHAAHERLLFEKMKKNMQKSDKRAVQMLLVPEKLSLSYAEINAAIEYQKELEDAGYLFAVNTGDNTAELTGLPGQVDKETALTIFSEMLTKLSAGEGDVEVTRAIGFEKALYTASCKAAMKGSRHDDDAHAEYLVKELLRLPDIRYCPHGRPIAYEIPKGSIDYKFGRS